MIIFYAFHLIGMEHYQQWNPCEYEKHTTQKTKDALKLFSSIPLKGNESIVDIGCGSGKITAYLAQKTCGEVIGVDFSPDMIDYATEQYKDFKNLSFIRHNAETFSTSNNDIITAFSSLHWMSNQKKVFCLVSSSLKNNGFFIATIAYKNSEQDTLLEALQKTVLSDRWMAYLSSENLVEEYLFSHNETTILPLLSRAKLITKKIKRQKKLFQFKNIQAYRDWLNSWIWGFSFLSRIPEQDKDNFLEDIVDRYSFEQLHSGKNPLEYESSTLQIIAKKTSSLK